MARGCIGDGGAPAPNLCQESVTGASHPSVDEFISPRAAWQRLRGPPEARPRPAARGGFAGRASATNNLAAGSGGRARECRGPHTQEESISYTR